MCVVELADADSLLTDERIFELVDPMDVASVSTVGIGGTYSSSELSVGGVAKTVFASAAGEFCCFWDSWQLGRSPAAAAAATATAAAAAAVVVPVAAASACESRGCR